MKNYSSTTVTIRNCMAVFTTLLLFCAVSSLQAQWKQCNGLYGGNISGLFTVGNTLYAQENGLFKSTDKGTTWSMTEIVLPYGEVHDIIEFGGKQFLAGGGVHASTNNGDSWKLVGKYTSGAAITTMGTDIFVDGIEGVCRSTDTGATWTLMKFSNPLHYVLSLATIGNTLFAGLRSKNPAEGGGIYSSSDNGKSWNLITFKNKYVSKLVASGHFLYARIDPIMNPDLDAEPDPDTRSGLYRSSDNGVSWKKLGTESGDISIGTFTINGTTIVGWAKKRIVISTDNGDSWNVSNNETSFYSLYSIALLDGAIFVGPVKDYTDPLTKGIYKSTDNGASFIPVGMKNKYIYSLGVIDNTIFAGTYTEGMYRSTDNGISWNESKIGSGSLTILSIGGYGSTVLAGTKGDGIYQSIDKGLNWASFSAGLKERTVHSMAVLGTTVIAGTDYGLYRYLDKDKVWKQISIGQPAKSQALTVIGTTLYGGGGGGVSVTTDYGETWTKIGLEKQNITILYAVGTILYACDSDKYMYVSSDYGLTWTKTGMPRVEVKSFVGNEKALFIATKGSGVYQSTDMGNTWTQMNNGMFSMDINAIVLNGNTLFAGADGTSMWMYENAVSVSEPQNPKENLSASQLAVYPNPANSSITINRSNSQFTENSEVRYSISSMVGSKIIETESSLESLSIPLKGIPSGVYLLSATQGTKQVSSTFVVLKQD